MIMLWVCIMIIVQVYIMIVLCVYVMISKIFVLPSHLVHDVSFLGF